MTSPDADRSPLRVGYVEGVIVTKWRTIWHERLPRVPLEVVEVPQAEQRSVLDAGAVDFVFARLPIDADGVHVIRLYDELPVAWVSKDHPVSLFDEVSSADLAGERVLTTVDAAAIDAVADGDAVLRVPLSVARTHSRRDLVHRVVTDADPTTVGLVWLRDNEHPRIQEFIGIVRGRTANSTRTDQERTKPRRGSG